MEHVTMGRSKPTFSQQWDELMIWFYSQAEQRPLALLDHLRFHHRWRVSRWLVDLVNFCMGVIVARGKNSSSTGRSTQQQYNTTFVNVTLSGVTITDVEKHFREAGVFDRLLTELLTSGYRIAVTYNAANDSFISSLTCRDEASPNANCTMTGFAGDWYSSLLVVLYKHYVVCERNWRAHGSTNMSGGIG